MIARSPRLASLLCGGLLCGISFAGCGGAELGAVEAPASAAPPARPLDRAGLVWVPRRDQLVVVQREGARAHVLAGPWRGIVEGERATWAPARTVDPIQSAIACAGGRGWVFTTGSQLVATADTFLGELRVLGAVRLDASQGTSREVAVHWDGGDAWVADCNGLRPITVPGGPIEHMAFSDASFGAAVLSDGRLAMTTDGGATFRAVALGEHAALGITAGPPGAIEVELTSGSRRLFADGRIEEVRAHAPHYPGIRASVEEGDAIVRRLLSHDALTREAAPLIARTADPSTDYQDSEMLRGAARRSDGSTLVMIGDRVSIYDAAGAREDVAAPADAESCEMLRSFGERAILGCGDEYGDEPASFYERVGGEWRSIALGDATLRSALAENGTHVAWNQPCREDARGGICVEALGGERRTSFWEDGEHADLVEMRGDRILARLGESFFFVIRAASDTVLPVGAPGDRDGRTSAGVVRAGRIDAAALHPDGDVIAFAMEGTSETHVYRGAPDALAPLALPAGASDVGFTSGGRGVAAGASAAQLWRTADDGASWQALALPLDGDPHAVELVDAWNVNEHARCDERGCLVRPRIYVGAEGARALAGPVVAAPAAAQVDAAQPGWPTLVCTPLGEELRESETDEDRRSVDASVRLEWDLGERGGVRTERLRWQAEDASGAFEGRGGLVGAPPFVRFAPEELDPEEPDLEEPDPEEPDPDGPVTISYHAEAATRAGLLVSRCAGGCRLYWVPAGAPRAPIEVALHRPVVSSVLPSRDGGLTVVLEEGERLFTVVEIAPRGPAIVRRRFAGAGFGAEAVRVGGRARIAMGWGDAPARLFELDPSVSEGFEEVEWPLLRPGLAVCADPPSASADLRWTPGVRIADVGPFQSVALVEARDGRSCVRAVHARADRRAAGDRASLWARRGVLEGWAAPGYGRLTRVRCTEAR